MLKFALFALVASSWTAVLATGGQTAPAAINTDDDVASFLPTFWQNDNITARYLQALAAEIVESRDGNGGFGASGREHFDINTRVPKKPLAQKNNFLSFETKNNNIEVGFEFSVPFLSVPVKRSVDSVRNTAQSVMTPLANINSGAIFLAGVMVLAGVTTAALWRAYGSADPYRRQFGRQAFDDTFGSERIAQLLAGVDELLQRYDIDATVCGPRLVCTMVQNAAERVAAGAGSSADKLVDGFFGNHYVEDWMLSTQMEQAMRIARSPTQRCERQFEACRLSPAGYELLSQSLFRFA